MANNWTIFNQHPIAQEIAQKIDNIPTDWALTPVRDKRPYRKNWQHEPPVSHETIKEGILNGNKGISQRTGKPYTAYDSGFGLRLGDISGGLLAIDVDGESAGPLLQAISGGDIPQTVAWTSGKTGRYQLLFQIPDEWRDRASTFTRAVLTDSHGIKTKHNDKGKPEELLEFRYNLSQSVLPPSYHPSTGSYKWINSPEDTEVAIAPNWLLDQVLAFANKEEEQKRKAQEQQQRRVERKRQRQTNGFIGADSLEDALEKAIDTLDYEDIFYWNGHNFKRNGRKLVGNCPQHESSSGTAFQINPDTKEWYCHGCQEGGHAIQYRHFLNGGNSTPTGQDFIAIARELCSEANVAFPERDIRLESERQKKLEAQHGKEITRDEWLAQKADEFWQWVKNKTGQIRFKGFDRSSPKNTDIPKVSKIRYGKDPLPTPNCAEGKLPTIEFEKGERLKLIQELIQLGWKDILDRSLPGSGKSHEFNLIEADEGKTWYIHGDHRNPTVAPAERKADLPARHNGLDLDHSRTTPSGQPFQRRWKWSEDNPYPDIPANCPETDRFNTLSSKGYKIHETLVQVGEEAKLENPICAKCPVLRFCKSEGYKAQRRAAMEQSTIRAHVDSMPSPEDYSYSADILIWEEVSTLFKATETRTLTQRDLDEQWEWLEKERQEVYQRLLPIKHKLNDILSGRVKIPHYGANTFPDAEGENDLKSLLGIEEYPELQADLQVLKAISDRAKGLSEAEFKEFDKTDRSSITPSERKRWKETAKFADAHLRKETWKENHTRTGNLPTLGLYELILIFFEDTEATGVPNLTAGDSFFRGGAVVANGEVTLTLRNGRHGMIADSAKINLYGDSTVRSEDLAAQREIEESKLITISQKQPDFSNLTVTGVHIEGMSSRQYSDECKHRQRAVVDAIKTEHEGEETALIAWKDTNHLERDGWWFNDSRSTNRFKGVPNLIAIGTPYQNYGSVKAQYYVIRGTLNGFDEYYKHLKEAEIIQLVGRQRAHLYPNENFNIYLIGTNLDLSFLEEMGLQVNLTHGLEYSHEAGHHSQPLKFALIQKALENGETFKKLTQTNLAKELGVTQGRISQILKEVGGKTQLLKLLAPLYREFIEGLIKPSAVAFIRELADWVQLGDRDLEIMGVSTVKDCIASIADYIRDGRSFEDFEAENQVSPFLALAIALGAESPPPD